MKLSKKNVYMTDPTWSPKMTFGDTNVYMWHYTAREKDYKSPYPSIAVTVTEYDYTEFLHNIPQTLHANIGKNSKFNHNGFLSNLCHSISHHLPYIWYIGVWPTQNFDKRSFKQCSDNITYKCLLINENWQTKRKKIMELTFLDSNVPDCHWEDRVTCNVPIWCDFDRASSLICGNKIPTRGNRWIFTNLIACSTCFGHNYAYHQELESIIQVVAASRAPDDGHSGARNMLSKQ